MKDDTSTPTPDDTSPNEFERDKPGTNARTAAEAAIEQLRQRGGIFVDAVRATRMPMALTDPTLPGNPIVFANDAFLKLSGYRMEEVLGQQPYFMNGPGTDPKDEARFREALRSDQDDIIETVQYRKNGSRFIATVLLSAFKDDSGKTVNHFMSWLDVTRRVEAEDEAAELRKSHDALAESERLRAAMLDVLPLGLALVDPEGKAVLFNSEWERFAPTSLIPSRDAERGWRWRSWDKNGDLVDPSNYPGARALRGESVDPPMEFLYVDDGEREIWTKVAAVPLRDADNQVIGAVCIIEDIDKAKRALQALQASERHSQTLLAELQHRVRNTLAVARSIARRTAERSSSTDEMLSHFEGRLNAFSRIQSAVTRSPETGVELSAIIDDELLAVAAREGDQLHVRGPAIALKARPAETISLAIHELATNAVKYGALSVNSGRVSVSWKRVRNGDQEQLIFKWVESGLRHRPEPGSDGFGHEMLRRTLPYELGAETDIEFTADGLRFTMQMPLGPNVLAERA